MIYRPHLADNNRQLIKNSRVKNKTKEKKKEKLVNFLIRMDYIRGIQASIATGDLGFSTLGRAKPLSEEVYPLSVKKKSNYDNESLLMHDLIVELLYTLLWLFEFSGYSLIFRAYRQEKC